MEIPSDLDIPSDLEIPSDSTLPEDIQTNAIAEPTTDNQVIVSFIKNRNNQITPLEELNRYLNNTFIRNVLRTKYPNKTDNQIRRYLQKKRISIKHNDREITLNDFENDVNNFVNDVDLNKFNYEETGTASNTTRNQFNVVYNYTTFHRNPMRLQNLTGYKKRFQDAADMVVRSVPEISNNNKDIFRDIITSVPTNERFILSYATVTNNVRTDTLITFSELEIENTLLILNSINSETVNTDYITSDSYGAIINHRIVDLSIVREAEMPNTRRNNVGAFFPYVHIINNRTINDCLKRCQIFNQKEINNENDKNLLTHCVESTLRYFNISKEETYLLKNILANYHTLYIEKSIFLKINKKLNKTIALIEYDTKSSRNEKRVTIYQNNQTKTNKTLKDLENIEIKIALYKHHYFPYVDLIPCSKNGLKLMYAKNYDDFNYIPLDTVDQVIWEDKENVKRVTTCDSKLTNTLDFIKKMEDLNLFKPMNVLIKNQTINNKNVIRINRMYEMENRFSIPLFEEDRFTSEVLPANVKYENSKFYKSNHKKIDEYMSKYLKALNSLGDNLLSDEDLTQLHLDLLDNSYVAKDDEKESAIIACGDGESVSIFNPFVGGKVPTAYSMGYNAIAYNQVKDIVNGVIEMPKKENIHVHKFYGFGRTFKIQIDMVVEPLSPKDYKDNKYKKETLKKLRHGENTYLGYVRTLNNERYFHVFLSSCVEQFLNSLYKCKGSNKKNDGEILSYFHNAKFDLALIMQQPGIKIIKKIEKEGNLFSATISWMGRKFKIVDSYKIISTKLEEFSKLFNFDTVKEYFPYDLIDVDIINKEIVSCKDLEKRYNQKEDKKINGKTLNQLKSFLLEANIKEVLLDANQKQTSNFNEIQFIDIKKYSDYYLTRDVQVLMLGVLSQAKNLSALKYNPIVSSLNPVKRFKKIFKKHYREKYDEEFEKQIELFSEKFIKNCTNQNKERKLNLFNYITSSSFADDFTKLLGCYNDVHVVKNSFRDFSQSCVRGGQTMCAYNKQHEKYFDDYDAEKIQNLGKIDFTNYYNDINTNEDLENAKKSEKKLLKYFNNRPNYLRDYNELKSLKENKSNNYKQKEKEFLYKHYGRYISDWDAVACYPSAMKEMEGFPTGLPEIFTKENLKDINNIVGFSAKHRLEEINNYIYNLSKNNTSCHYYVQIKFKGKFRNSHFPLFKVPLQEMTTNKITEKDSKQWENRLSKEGEFVEKYHLQAIIETHEPDDFEFISGFYYPDGYNSKINGVICELKAMRDKYKKEGNPLEAIIKLIMNSIYGKTLLKAQMEQLLYFFGSFDEILDKVESTLSSLKTLSCSNGYEKQNYVMKKTIPDFDHCNRAHIGAAILGYSKLIMSRPKIIADMIYRECQNIKENKKYENENVRNKLEDHIKKYGNKILDDYILYYGDTDSLMGRFESILLISELYKEIYGKDLEGREFGQFHIDYSMSNEWNDKFENVFAIAGIWKNKKEYCLILEGFNTFTNRLEYVEKFAFKGINGNIIESYAKKNYPEKTFPIFALFTSNKIHKIETVGEGTFKLTYKQKGTVAVQIDSLIKNCDMKNYINTYDKFIKL